MATSAWNRKLIALVLAAVLASTGLPARSLRAQDDETALITRALGGILTANAYVSYESTIDLDWQQEWTAISNDQAIQGQGFQFIRHEQGRTATTPTGPNIHQIVTADQTVSVSNTPPQRYTLDGEIRFVDGQTYVKATYAETAAGAPEVPDGWVQLTDASNVQTWPGLSVMVNPLAFLDPEADAVYRLLNASGSDLPDIFDQFVTGASSAPGTLDDGTPVEIITLTLDRDGAMALQTLGLDLTQPVMKMIFEAIPADPLTMNVLLDSAGQLVGLDYTLAVDLRGLDASWMPNVPADMTLDVRLAQTFSARLMAINTPLELVAAPDLRGQAALTAYNAPQAAEPVFWWNDRVFYEIFVRSFYDSDGDGIGDLRGVIEKLDYLNDGDPATTTDLGVTGLWLMPIMESPSYHGYDVADYFTVEADYGTNQDFKDLMEAAHARGMVVIVDMVLNHTSTESPWFEASSAGDPQYADWYIWSNTDPGTLSPWGSQTWYPANGRYYYGLFWSGMPDLNYDTLAVTEMVNEISRFWLEDMGADGFRLDAIRHLFEDFDAQPPILQNAPDTLQWLTGYHAFVKATSPDALMVGEVWDVSANVAPYVGDRIDIAFEFDLATAIIMAAQAGNADNLLRVQNTVLKTYPFAQYATFLTNHDQNRVMSQLVGNKGTAKVAATILLTVPGVPFIYYGEEIGMQGTKPDERIRTPMQWDDSKPAGGFSTVTPWEALAIGYNRATVAGETDDPDSLLNHYRALIHLRDEHPALRTGTIQLVEITNSSVYSFLRYGEDETLLIVVNLSKKNPVTDYTLTAVEGLLDNVTQAELLLGDGAINAPAINESGGFIDYIPLAELPPQSSFVIRLY